jgi:ATP synthase I chain
MRLWQPAMPDQRSDVDITQTAATELFYSRALNRIGIFMPVISVLITAAAWLKFSWRSAIGFAFGCVIAYINFVWLKRVIAGFVDRATGSATKQSGEGIVFRFLFRYVLMGLGAYVILTVSPASLHGLLAGLFLPVAAILCEAVYEVYAALAHGV